MSVTAEQRDTTRVKHRASILLENFLSGTHYKAEMHNYSRGGLYFESDYAPLPGTEIYIGIEKSPYDLGPDLYRAKVRWRKELSGQASKYAFGVGVKYHYPIGL